jgi:hypothetical protein
MARHEVRAKVEHSFPPPKEEQFTLEITGLTQAQIAFIRCMLEIDYEVDPVADWGFKRKDGDLQNFRLQVATEIEKKGF